MRDPSLKARALRDPDGRYVRAPWTIDPPAWRRSIIRERVAVAGGCPQRRLYHDLFKGGWSASDIEATLCELGVIERRVFGEPFPVLVLPDARPEPRLPAGPQFGRPRGGGPLVDGLGNKRPAGAREVRPFRLGGRKV
jgi:hypothetical protein